MSAASIPGFRGYIRSQNVKQSLEQVKSDLRSVQTKAMAGTLSDEANVSYWGVSFVPGRSTYSNFTVNSSFTGIANQGTSENLVGDAIVRQSRTIYFSIPVGDAYTFGGTPCDATGTNCSVLIGPVGSNGNDCAQIRVNSAGGMFKEEGVACVAYCVPDGGDCFVNNDCCSLVCNGMNKCDPSIVE